MAGFLSVGTALVAAILVTMPAPALAQAAAPATVHPIANAPVELRAAIARADTIFTEVRSAHLVELTGAMTAGGNGGAMATCHVAAGQVIERTKRTEGIAVGRTSDRLRNPTNIPPAWAAPTVARYAGMQASKVDGFYADLGDRVGVLRPVAEVAICAGCHGPASAIPSSVRNALKDRYPADQAVGFKDGEIRGWLWAEVPKGMANGTW